jgi:hypothetical protein
MDWAETETRVLRYATLLDCMSLAAAKQSHEQMDSDANNHFCIAFSLYLA